MKLWHYTIDQHYNNIIKDEYIKLPKVFIPEGGLPAVWMSINQDWENSVKKTIIKEDGEKLEFIGRDELFKINVIPIRIEINPNNLKLYNWEGFKRLGNMSTSLINSFETETAQDWNYDIHDWYVSFEPIPISEIDSVEIWDGDKWVKHC